MLKQGNKNLIPVLLHDLLYYDNILKKGVVLSGLDKNNGKNDKSNHIFSKEQIKNLLRDKKIALNCGAIAVISNVTYIAN